MRLLQVFFSNVVAISEQQMAMVHQILESEGATVVQMVELSDSELTALCASRDEKPTAIRIPNSLRPEEITFAQIKAATTYLLETYGEPDDEDTFRIRLQMAIRSDFANSERHIRTSSAVEILSKLVGKSRLPNAITSHLRESGLAFLPAFCKGLMRFKDM